MNADHFGFSGRSIPGWKLSLRITTFVRAFSLTPLVRCCPRSELDATISLSLKSSDRPRVYAFFNGLLRDCEAATVARRKLRNMTESKELLPSSLNDRQASNRLLKKPDHCSGAAQAARFYMESALRPDGLRRAATFSTGC
jgi:hypothetical protein